MTYTLRFCGCHAKGAERTLGANNPRKIPGLPEQGVAVVERVPLQVQAHPLNEKYWRTKAKKSGHRILIKTIDNELELAG